MFQGAQLVSGLPSELGVQGQYLDREGDFVGDALAGSVAIAEQFEVVRPVVGSHAVDVMHCFFGEKFASNLLLHYVAVFENITSRCFSVLRRDVQRNVVFAHAPGYLRTSVFFSVYFTNPFVFTLFRTKCLRVVDSTRTFAACFVKFFAAIFTICFVSLICCFAASLSRAWHRTVEWVFTEFFVVGRQVGSFYRERFAAFPAGEFDSRYPCRRSPMKCFVGSVACRTAEFSVAVLGLNTKDSLAVLTGFLDRHRYSLMASTTRGIARVAI